MRKRIAMGSVFIGLAALLWTSVARRTTDFADDPAAPAALDKAFSAAVFLPHLRAMAVSKDGRVLRATGYGKVGLDDPFDVRSVTKSVVALLAGIAVEDGSLASVDEPIGPLLALSGYHLPADAARIRVRDLLAMRSGFEWTEAGARGYGAWWGADDQAAFALARPLAVEPGAKFNYDSPSYHLLAVVLTSATGRDLLDYAREKLFDPIGAGEVSWQSDRQGVRNGAAGLSVSARTMLRIGQLVLGEGRFEGRRVVGADWIRAMTSGVPTEPGGQFRYGFGWWAHDEGDPVGPVYFAQGYGGQFIVAAPRIGVAAAGANDWAYVLPFVLDYQLKKSFSLLEREIPRALAP